MRFDPSLVSQMAFGLLLVKLIGLSIVCFVVVTNESFVRCRWLLATVFRVFTVNSITA